MQRCAVCKGPTRWDPEYGSNYCPKCGCYTANSDGLEEDRLLRYIGIAWPVIQRLLAPSDTSITDQSIAATTEGR